MPRAVHLSWHRSRNCRAFGSLRTNEHERRPSPSMRIISGPRLVSSSVRILSRCLNTFHAFSICTWVSPLWPAFSLFSISLRSRQRRPRLRLNSFEMMRSIRRRDTTGELRSRTSARACRRRRSSFYRQPVVSCTERWVLGTAYSMLFSSRKTIPKRKPVGLASSHRYLES